MGCIAKRRGRLTAGGVGCTPGRCIIIGSISVRAKCRRVRAAGGPEPKAVESEPLAVVIMPKAVAPMKPLAVVLMPNAVDA